MHVHVHVRVHVHVGLHVLAHNQVTGGHGYVILGTEANEQQALSYGCIVEDPNTHKVGCRVHVYVYVQCRFTFVCDCEVNIHVHVRVWCSYNAHVEYVHVIGAVLCASSYVPFIRL